MRWYWFDRFTEFQSGQRAVGIKNVTLAEEHVLDYVPRYPSMPNSLVIEGLAQLGGLLVGEISHFRTRVVLAKVSSARFHFTVRPGDSLLYTVIIENRSSGGALVSGTSHVGDRLQAEVDLYLAILTDNSGPDRLYAPRDLLRMLRALRLFEVGRDCHGNPLEIPEYLHQSIVEGMVAGSS